MRYLKIFAQDRTGAGQADTVLLQFYQSTPGIQDSLISHAVAYDFPTDGEIDYSRGDVTNDGRETRLDKVLLDRFAAAYLKLNWFNPGTASTRHMKIFSEDFYKDGTPDTVRLHVQEGAGVINPPTLVAWNAAYDFDNDGMLEWNIHFDINHDGVIDDVDQRLVQQLAELYLLFNWHEPEAFEVKVVDIPAS
ncbi:hypothetical protein SAMN04490179_1062 [Pseudomonas antarctica]|uniref:Uncharacterized protein n=1 Tax=Pseudomonas antarctica TaxID=219572 RepID=A0A1G9WB49_9PSED|nr:hypothetical protein [Pseudomonas antarctica]KAF2409306.1 hypothetical protein PSAN_17110 [Pseudomonas antarctica]SDM81537.1 hypothetical protein SAMN04490179_1062 [Pseudomonas antarctica]